MTDKEINEIRRVDACLKRSKIRLDKSIRFFNNGHGSLEQTYAECMSIKSLMEISIEVIDSLYHGRLEDEIILAEEHSSESAHG